MFERAKKLIEDTADAKIGNVFAKLVTIDKLKTINAIFVVRFTKELDSAIDLPTITAKSYAKDLGAFLQHPSVQERLIEPLDGHTRLDGDLLSGIWASLNLIAIPEDFDWGRVARRYGDAIRSQALSDDKLRPVIVALAGLRAAQAAEKNLAANTRAADAIERMAPQQRAFDLGRYAMEIKREFGHLKLGSIDSDWARYENRIRLENVYVPQSAKPALPPIDLTRDYRKLLKQEGRDQNVEQDEAAIELVRRKYTDVDAEPILEVVDAKENRNLVILGDPGLGKSTLLKSLALAWAENPENRPLTLFVELRKVEGHTFFEYLEHGTGPGCGLPRQDLEDQLRNKASRVLLDGLDEVSTDRRDDIAFRIIQFSGDYPMSQLIVTTRIHGYISGSQHPEQFRDAGFSQFTLQDFTQPEIEAFVGKWHREAFQDSDEVALYGARLRAAISGSPAIAELAANPLLLTMMAILSRNRDLPRDRCDLYERCGELLLRNWDLDKFPKKRELSSDVRDKLGPKEKMRILERVAEAMQYERTGLAGNLIAQEKLESIVQDELQSLGVRDAWSLSNGLIQMLRERNFMLAYLGDQQYAFIHRTFLEYFCARDLQYRLQKTTSLSPAQLADIFRQNWRQDAWHEPLRLLCGLIGTEFAQLCIAALVDISKEEEGASALMLAETCLREVRKTSDIIQAGYLLDSGDHYILWSQKSSFSEPPTRDL